MTQSRKRQEEPEAVSHKVTAGNLSSWNARRKLEPSAEPYWCRLGTGQALGYYRPKEGAGTWRGRVYLSDTKEMFRDTLGFADDGAQEAGGGTVLDYDHALTKFTEWAKDVRERRSDADAGPAPVGPLTIEDALRVYFDKAKSRGVRGLDRDRIRAQVWIIPQLGRVEVLKLTRERIEKWLDEIAAAPRRVRTAAPKDPAAPAPKPRNFKVPRPAKVEPAPPAPPATAEEKRARKDSANRVLTVLKAALNDGLDRHLITGTDGAAWRLAKPFRGTTKARVRFLTVEEQVRLVNACPPDFRRLVQGALFTGGRYGELARAQVQDFDATGGTLFLVGKGTGEGKPRHVVLTDEGRAFFQEITAGLPAGDLIFQRDKVKRRKHSARGLAWGHAEQVRFMNAACDAAKVERLTVHELRHTYASMLVNQGVPLAYVAAQLGHSDTRMVEKHYGHLAPNALAESIRKLAPKLGLFEPAEAKVSNLLPKRQQVP